MDMARLDSCDEHRNDGGKGRPDVDTTLNAQTTSAAVPITALALQDVQVQVVLVGSVAAGGQDGGEV